MSEIMECVFKTFYWYVFKKWTCIIYIPILYKYLFIKFNFDFYQIYVDYHEYFLFSYFFMQQ